MKKKIKNLTLEEKEQICSKHENKPCWKCPLHIGDNLCVKDYIETEVEIDE